MSRILEGALAPLIIALIWVIAMFTLMRTDAGGLEPVLAGFMGGAALILQACTSDVRRARQVFGLRAPIAAACAVLAFLIGIAISLSVNPDAASRTLVTVAKVTISTGGISLFLIRLGVALALASIIAQSGTALMSDGEVR
jgi:hypothetical protein